MLKIKLARFGKRSQPHYRIVVTEQRDKRDGQYLESLGSYAPTQAGKPLTIDKSAYDAWVKKGAQPTASVAQLYKRSTSTKAINTPATNIQATDSKKKSTKASKSEKTSE